MATVTNRGLVRHWLRDFRFDLDYLSRGETGESSHVLVYAQFEYPDEESEFHTAQRAFRVMPVMAPS